MYSRELKHEDGSTRTATFGVSGRLWHGVLVMHDRESGSLWTQLAGRAIEGDERGTQLTALESIQTTWAAWKALHPETLVLRKSAEDVEVTESRYAAYFADRNRLFLPSLAQGLGEIAAKEPVFGVFGAAGAVAVTEALLRERGVVNARLGERQVALLYDPATGAVSARQLADGGSVQPAPDGGGALDAATGRPLDWDALPPLRVDRAFWYAWKRSHPETTVVAK